MPVDYALWNRLQHDAVDALYAGCERGINPALQGATGCGKTRIAGLLANRLLPHGKVLVVATTTEIVDSFEEELQQTCGIAIGREQAGFKRPRDERLIIASLASLGRSAEGRLADYRPTDFAAIIWDEADGNAVANTMTRNIARHFGAVDSRGRRQPSAVRMVGMSATWLRHDRLTLGGEFGLFDSIVANIERRQLEEAGILVPLIPDPRYLDLEVPLTKQGEVDSEAWGRLINTPYLNDAAASFYLDEYADKQAIFFCPTVDHAHAMQQRLSARGVVACLVHGEMRGCEREQAYRGLRSGQYQAVCVKECYTRGSNIPSLGVAFHLDATRSKARRIQRGGRIARSWDAESWDSKADRLGDPWCGDWWGLQREKTVGVEVDFVGLCRLPLALPPTLLAPEHVKDDASGGGSPPKVIKPVDDREFTGRHVRGPQLAPVHEDPVEFGWCQRGDVWFMATPSGELTASPVDDGWLVGWPGKETWWETTAAAFEWAHRLLRGKHPALDRSDGASEPLRPEDAGAFYRSLS